MVVLDTCALYWWTVEPEALSPRGLAACRRIAESGALACSVSLWELGLKAKSGRITLACSIRDYAERLAQVAGLEIVAADTSLWLDSLELDWVHRDPADRLIVALAKRRRLPIITADELIRGWYAHAIW